LTEGKITVIVRSEIVGKVITSNHQELAHKLKFILQKNYKNHPLQANIKDQNSLKIYKVVERTKKTNNLTHNILPKIKIFLEDNVFNRFLHKRRVIKYTLLRILDKN
jgi:hypothetical protein